MSKKVIVWIVGICLSLILLRLLVSRPKEGVDEPKQIDFAEVAKNACRTQGKLLVMRMFATTTVYRENRATAKATAQVGYVHDGSADIIVDLTKSEFQYREFVGGTNLVVVVPCPELDRTSIGIDPSKMKRVTSIPRTKMRRQAVFTALEDECKKVIVERQCETFSSVDVIEDAKIQARRVLTNFFRNCVDAKIDVEVEFVGENKPYSPNPDVKPVNNEI